jgi:ANTAR domain
LRSWRGAAPPRRRFTGPESARVSRLERPAPRTDPNFVRQAAKRGVFAYVTDAQGENWQSSIDIPCTASPSSKISKSAFGRRAIIERAKGILMERHSVHQAGAFELLRNESRAANRKLIQVATAVADGHRLLPKPPAWGT